MLLALTVLLTSLDPARADTACPVPLRIPFEVEKVIPRSRLGFTEGLTFLEGRLLESSGYAYKRGKPDGVSTVNAIDLGTGQVSEVAQTPGNAFGEGLQALNGRILPTMMNVFHRQPRSKNVWAVN